MEMKQTNLHLQVLREKYDKLNSRLQRSIREGRFLGFSFDKKRRLFQSLSRYEKQLRQWGIAVTAGVAMFMPGNELLAQNPMPVGGEFRVNTITIQNQFEASVAFNKSDGDFVIAWQDNSNGSVIKAQRYNSAGAAQGAEFQVNNSPFGARLPSVAMDSDGDFVIAWEYQDGSNFGIFARRYNSAGVAQGTEFQANTYTTSNQYSPSVAMDSDGDFVIAWQSSGQDGSGWGIYAQRYNNAGVAQGTEFRVNTYTSLNQSYPSVGMDNNGNFVVTWHDDSLDGNYTSIYAQRYNNAGVAQGSEFQVNTYTTGDQNYPSVAMDSDGDFVIAWFGNGQNGFSHDIYAQRYNNAGVAQGSEFRVNTYTSDVQYIPSVGMDSDGDFVIAWGSSYQDGWSYGIYAQRYNNAGTAQGTEFRVNTYTTIRQSNPSVGMDNNGNFAIAWESSLQDGHGYGVYAQRYAPPCPPTTDWYTDSDGDGYGTGTAIPACVPPPNTVAINGDCNDSNSAINPAALEICNSDVDDDCDGLADNADPSVTGQNTYYADADGDGYGAGTAIISCTQPANTSANDDDCDDGDSAINPAALEICNSDVDDDCDGLADNADPSVSGQNTYYTDGDGDGYGAGTAIISCTQPANTSTNDDDCDDNNSAINPNAQETCNGDVDDDCDGLADNADPSVTGQNTYYADADGDGYGAGAAVLACTQPANTSTSDDDCDDNETSVNPGATEICNTIDDDCDLSIDEVFTNTYYADGDGDGYGAGAAILACTQPANTSTNDDDCDDNETSVNPGATEICNLIDDDCDLSIDEFVTNTYYTDADGDGYGAGAAILACTQPANTSTNNTDCNDNAAAVNPGAQEICNGDVDDDCDGLADNADPSVTGQNTYYTDVDGDGFGTGAAVLACLQGAYSSNNDDCNDNNNAVNPAATELCNPVDDDCDGDLNEGFPTTTWYRDADNDGKGNAAISVQSCYQPAGYVANALDCDDNSATACPKPSMLVTSDVTDNSATVSWGYLPCATKYRLEYRRKTNPATNWVVVYTTVPTYTITGLNGPNILYQWRVATICSPNGTAAESGYANPLQSFTTKYRVYTDADADNFGAMGSSPVFVHPFPQPGYSLVATDCDDAVGTIYPAASELCNGVDDDCDMIVDEGANWYQDADGDGLGNAAVSQNSCLQPEGFVLNSTDCNDNSNVPACSAPGGVNVNNIGNTFATVNWTAVPCASVYNIMYRNPAGVWSSNVSTSGTGYVITGLSPGATYLVRVRSKCPSPNTVPSSAWVYVSFTTSVGPMGLTESNDEQSDVADLAGVHFDVYPNPGDGLFNIRLTNEIDDHVNITVTDGFGKLVHTAVWAVFEGQTVDQLDLTHLSGGVYQVQIQQGDMISTKKIVIVK